LSVQVVVCLIVLKRAVVTIPAHDNRIAAMSFNSLGNRIATASEKVTSFSLSCDDYITVIIIICLGSVLLLISVSLVMFQLICLLSGCWFSV